MRDTATQRNASALPNWEATSFGAVADFINGYAFKPSDWSKFGLPIIRIAQMLNADTATDHYEGELPNAYRIDDGDLLFSWSATLATVMWTRGPAWLNQHLFKVVPKAGNSARFLHHLIDFHIESLAAQSHGTTMRHIKRGDLLSYPVLRPNPTEQSRIAAMLDTVDDEIAKTETVIAKLRQVRAGLLHDLLTRGLDEHGQLRDPIAHPEQFQDSPLGRIPNEWDEKFIDEIADVTKLAGFEFTNFIRYSDMGEIIALRALNIKDERLDLSDIQRIPKSASDSLPRSKIFAGDILITYIGAYIGDVLLITENDRFHLAPNIAKVTAKAGTIPEFLQWQLRSASTRRQIGQLITTTATPSLTMTQIRNLRLGIPRNIQEQRTICGRIDSVDAAIRPEQMIREKMIALKSGLTTDLLTGRVRVPEHFGMRRHDAALSSQAPEPASGPFCPESAHQSGDTSPHSKRDAP